MRSSITKIFLSMTLLVFGSGILFSQTFEILSPPVCAGTYEIGLPGAGFGPDYSVAGGTEDVCGNSAVGLPTIESDLIVTLADAGDNPNFVCITNLPITNDISGKIAMLDRGECFFVEKALNCQNAGAAMVIICNRDDEVIPMGGTEEALTIPTIMLKLSDCNKLKVELENGSTISARYSQTQTGVAGPENIVSNPNPPTGIVWMEDFADGMDGWTSVGVASDYAEQPVDELVWSYEAGWADQYNIGIATIGAACNGAVIFDANAYGGEYGGTGGDFMICELISPTIDLSGRGLMQLSVTQLNLPLNGSVSFAYSSDNGATWSEDIPMPTENVANDFDNVATEFITIPLFDLEATSECKIKFTANQDYYWIYLDDIIISELTGTNASIAGVSYWPSYSRFPLEHACADPFDFSVAVSNTGAEAISSVQLDVTVTNVTTGQVAFTGDAGYFLLGIGETETLTVEAQWVPTEVGVYRIDHTISVPNQTENTLDDNVANSQFFEVTDGYYSTHGQGDLSFNSSFQWEEYGVGVVYASCSDASEVLASCLQTYIDSDDPITSMVGNYVTVDILRLTDGFTTLTEFDISNIELFGNPQLEIVHEIIYEFTEDDIPGTVISIPFLEGGELFPLTPGEVYMFYIHFDNFQFGDAEVANSGLGVGFYQDANQTNNQFLRSIDEGQWFGGFTGANAYMSLDLNECRVIEADVPVELSKFTANANSVDISLDWATQSEVNNAGFEIERSIDGKEFSKIGFVGADEANSNREKEYAYTDRDVVANVTYYYRLKQVDIDGRFEYSGIVNATIAGNTTTSVSDFYPNPVSVHDLAQLTVTSESDTDASYALYNQNGVQVANRKLQLSAGSNAIAIDKDGLTTGMYIMKFNINNETFVKKMILID